MGNYDRETTVTIDGKKYKAFISLRDMEKMQEYVRTRKEQVDANRHRYEKLEKRFIVGSVLVICFLVILLAVDSYFGISKDWPTFVQLALMILPVLGFFIITFPGTKFMFSNPERYYYEPNNFTKARELEHLLADADLAQGIFLDDGYSKLGVIRNDTRIMEYVSWLGKMKVGYHDQDYVLVEGFAEDYLNASKSDYHLRVLLPLQMHDSMEGWR